MSGPNYVDYTINELLDCESNINKEKFPERYEIIKREISLRTEAGEIESNPAFNECFCSDVPLSIGIRVWWCYVWRSCLAVLIISLIFFVVALFVNKAVNISKETMIIVQTLFGVISFPIVGVFIMIQALAKRYYGYRIYFRKIEERR